MWQNQQQPPPTLSGQQPYYYPSSYRNQLSTHFELDESFSRRFLLSVNQHFLLSCVVFMMEESANVIWPK